MTPCNGLKFEVKEGTSLLLTLRNLMVHGAFVVLHQISPNFLVIRPTRICHLISTAKPELTQIIEGMVAGESIHVILQELFSNTPKILKTANMPALFISTDR